MLNLTDRELAGLDAIRKRGEGRAPAAVRHLFYEEDICSRCNERLGSADG